MSDVAAFLDELASSRPIPGGGSVAALEVAMGAALLAMVANLTIGRKRYLDVQAQAETVRDRAEQIRARAWQLVDEDSRAYARVSDAMALPRSTESDKAERRRRIQEALRGAAGPPLDTMAAAREVVVLADELVQFGNRSAASDVGSAVLAAVAGHRSARLNVEINVAGVDDADWVRATESELERYGLPAGVAERVLDRVEAIIRGEEG